MSSFRKASTPLGRGVGTFSRVTRERSHYCKLHTTHIQLVHTMYCGAPGCQGRAVLQQWQQWCVLYTYKCIYRGGLHGTGRGARLAAAADPDETEKRLEKWMQSS